LGPFLFCLVIDSLSPVCSNTHVVKYADDVSFLHFVRDLSDDNLQKEWDCLLSWAQTVKLPLNLDKCCVMDFVTKRDMQLPPIRLTENSSNCLAQVQSMCFLGVTFSNDFKWNLHFQNLIKKASKRLFLIRNLRRARCPPHLLFRCYSSFIRSLLLYAYPAFCNAPEYLHNKLFRFENRAFRIMNLDSKLHPSLESSMTSLCDNLFMQIAKSPDHPLRSMFQMKASNRTRSTSSLVKPFTRTKRYKNSFIKYCK